MRSISGDTVEMAVSYTHLDVYKRQTHESTGFTPHELIRGTRPPRILEQLFEYPPEGQVLDRTMKIRLANENLLTRGERRKQKHDANGKWTCLLYTSRCV